MNWNLKSKFRIKCFEKKTFELGTTVTLIKQWDSGHDFLSLKIILRILGAIKKFDHFCRISISEQCLNNKFGNTLIMLGANWT